MRVNTASKLSPVKPVQTLRDMRVNVGISQDRMAMHLDISTPVYVQIEKGLRPMTEMQRDEFARRAKRSPESVESGWEAARKVSAK